MVYRVEKCTQLSCGQKRRLPLCYAEDQHLCPMHLALLVGDERYPSVIMSGCPKPGCLARSCMVPGSNTPRGCHAHRDDWTWYEYTLTGTTWTKPQLGLIDALRKAGFHGRPWLGEQSAWDAVQVPGVAEHFRTGSSK